MGVTKKVKDVEVQRFTFKQTIILRAFTAVTVIACAISIAILLGYGFKWDAKGAGMETNMEIGQVKR